MMTIFKTSRIGAPLLGLQILQYHLQEYVINPLLLLLTVQTERDSRKELIQNGQNGMTAWVTGY